MKEPEFATSDDSLWNRIPKHLRDGLERYLNNHIRPGNFLTAVLENDLKGACGYADEESYAGLKDLLMYLHWEVGIDCYGSKEKVNEWLKNIKLIENHNLRDSSG